MIVLTRHQDNVEAINSTLRNAGHPVHCNWIRELNDLGDALAQINGHMLVAFVGADPADTAKIMTVCKQFGADVPVLIARDHVDEEIIAAAMKQGARDVVTLMHPQRLQAVVNRELEAHRQTRALNTTISSAREYREQLKSFMAGSADAIAYVQEGILIDVNPAWLELFGHASAEAVNGTPLMDTFDASAHAAIKGALVACLQGKWAGHLLRANALLGNGSETTLEIELSKAEFDGEPAVRLSVAAKKRDGGNLDEQLTHALERDAATGALQRRFFIERLKKAVSQPIKAGVRQLICVEPDKLSSIFDEVGPLATEEFVGQFAGLVAETRQTGDLYGRFGDGALVILMERGTPRDIEVWAQNLQRKLSGQVFRIGEKQISCTCSVGLGAVDPRKPDIAVSLNDAITAQREAQQAGGNRVQLIDHQEEDTRQQQSDEIWVRFIKAALMENRFRLMQQPIASLLGEDRGMFDVLVRMIERAGGGCIALRVHGSRGTQRPDEEHRPLGHWRLDVLLREPPREDVVRAIVQGLGPRQVAPALACEPAQSGAYRSASHRFPGERAGRSRIPVRHERVRKRTASRRFSFRARALRHGRDPHRLLAHLPVDFIKIDGTLMQGLSVDQDLQQRVREFVEQAKARKVGTIAERVEDANTMAVLWQLGVEFIQGYFVNEPEQVTIG